MLCVESAEPDPRGCVSVAPSPAVPSGVGGGGLISTSQADKPRLSKTRPPEPLGKGRRAGWVLLGRENHATK